MITFNPCILGVVFEVDKVYPFTVKILQNFIDYNLEFLRKSRLRNERIDIISKAYEEGRNRHDKKRLKVKKKEISRKEFKFKKTYRN